MIKVRSYENENDFVLMQNLIRENYLKSGEQLYPSPADLEYWRYLYDDSPDGVRWTRLWFDDDHLLAFAWMNEEATDFVCHYQHKDLLNQIIDWSESERLKQRKKKNCKRPVYFRLRSKERNHCLAKRLPKERSVQLLR